MQCNVDVFCLVSWDRAWCGWCMKQVQARSIHIFRQLCGSLDGTPCWIYWAEHTVQAWIVVLIAFLRSSKLTAYPAPQSSVVTRSPRDLHKNHLKTARRVGICCQHLVGWICLKKQPPTCFPWDSERDVLPVPAACPRRSLRSKRRKRCPLRLWNWQGEEQLLPRVIIQCQWWASCHWDSWWSSTI